MTNRILAIRRENKSVWERRVALTPSDVQKLLESTPNLTILVQPSPLRIFPDSEYTKAGATLQEDISSAHVIIGVKEIPIEYLMPNKTYMYFSHTIKAQQANMPALDHILHNKIRLIDYEKICQNKQRLVAFGRFAGLAGMQDFLAGFGLFLLQKGIDTPFKNLALSYKYHSLKEIFEDLAMVKQDMLNSGLSQKKESWVGSQRGRNVLGPIIFGLTGSNGRVGQGALEILKGINIKEVQMEDLDSIFSDGNEEEWNSYVYVVSIEVKHMVDSIDGKPWEK
jgi:alpha-aminoadipic semialdehyde synthase